MQLKVSLAFVTVLALAGCKNNAPASVQASDQSAIAPQGETGQIKSPKWIDVAHNTEGKTVYVNANSILVRGDKRRAEIAFNSEIFQLTNFDCKERVASNTFLEGEKSAEFPVFSTTVFAPAFNYVCYGKINDGFGTEKLDRLPDPKAKPKE